MQRMFARSNADHALGFRAVFAKGAKAELCSDADLVQLALQQVVCTM